MAELGEKETAFFRAGTRKWPDHSVTHAAHGGLHVREAHYMETWLSGRKRLTANEVRGKTLPGFESLRLRNDP